MTASRGIAALPPSDQVVANRLMAEAGYAYARTLADGTVVLVRRAGPGRAIEQHIGPRALHPVRSVPA